MPYGEPSLTGVRGKKLQQLGAAFQRPRVSPHRTDNAVKNHWNSTIKRKVDTGGFPNEPRDCKPVYLLLELDDKDQHRGVQPVEGQVSVRPCGLALSSVPGWLVCLVSQSSMTLCPHELPRATHPFLP